MIERPRDHDFAMPSLRLDGRVALVTGAGRGLGRGVALALAHAGADVALTARSAPDLASARAQVQGTGARGLELPCDVTGSDAPGHLVDAVLAAFGRLDIVVHAAGVNVRQPADAFTRDDWQRVMRTNVEAPFFLSLAAARAMRGDEGRSRRGGRIICLTSVAAEIAIPNVSAYAMSKGALKQMVKALAVEWAREGITVNAIAPGRFWTAMTDAVFSDPALHAGAVSAIPLGRPGVAADLAGAAVMLASDAGAYITGQTIIVDGGWTAGAGVKG